MGQVVGTRSGMLNTAAGGEIETDKSFATAGSVLFDAVFVPGGASSVAALRDKGDAVHFVNEAYKHCKPIGSVGEGVELLQRAELKDVRNDLAGEGVTYALGVVTARDAAAWDDWFGRFREALMQHRHWDRHMKEKVPA